MIPTLDDPVDLVFPTFEEIVALLPDTSTTQRFLEKVEVGPVPEHNPALGPCLLWTRATSTEGYGLFRDEDGKVVQTHVWLYKKRGLPIPDGHELDHLCHDWRLCTVPARDCPHRPCALHVAAVPALDNLLRSNTITAVNARKTHCHGKYSPRDADGNIVGHDWTIPGNLRIDPKTGRRICVPCGLEADRQWKLRKKGLHASAAQRGLPKAEKLTIPGL